MPTKSINRLKFSKQPLGTLCLFCFLTFALCLPIYRCNPAGAAENLSDWYPSNISPPAGLKYPCALTPLPRSLTGIPEGDRQFINHSYSMILKCLQAKLVMLADLYKDNTNHTSAYSRYYYDTAAARTKLLNEKAPAGLEAFKRQAIAAIDMQVAFFNKATQMRNGKSSMDEVLKIPEGRQASTMLQQAWGEMATRYPAMGSDVKDSIYHHLCALDLF